MKILLWFALLCSLSPSASARDAAGDGIDFVYFGSPECSYCRAWEKNDLPKLEGAELFHQVRFSKITKAIASAVPAVSSFPDEIKHLREPIAEKIEGAGSPMFAILSGGQVVASWRGSKKYSPEQILKIIAEQQARLSSGSIHSAALYPVLARTSRAAPGALSANLTLR